MWLALVAVFLLLLGAPAAKAQYTVVTSCTAPGKNYPIGSVQSGTMDITGLLCTNATGGGGGGGTSSNFGAAFPAAGTAAGAEYLSSPPTLTSGQMVALQTDVSGNLKMTCVSGCATTAFADESTFTQGTTSFSPIGGIYNTTITNLSSGQAGAVQLTPDRMMYVNLGKFGGTAVTIGQQAMAASIPVAIANNQSALTVAQATAANLNATVVGTGTFAVQATQAGTWNVGLSTGANLVGKVDILGNAGAAMDVAQGGATAAANALQVAGVFNTTPPTLTTGQGGALQLDSSGNLRVNVAVGGGGGTVTQGPGAVANPWYVAQSGNWSMRLQDGSGNAINSTSNALNVNISSSGATLTTTISGTVTASVSQLPAAVALSDALSNPTTTEIGANMLGWDATNSVWRRVQVAAGTGNLNVNVAGPSFGAAFPATGFAIGFHNASGNMDYGSVVNDASAGHDLQISCGPNPCNATDENAYTAGTTGYSNVGCFWQTTYTTGPLTTGQAGVAQCGSKYRSVSVTPYDSTGAEMDNTTAHSVKVSPLDSGGGDMSDTTDHALQEVLVPTAAAAYGIAPVVSTAVESNHVLKASAVNLYGVMVQTGATAGCLMVFNATSAPADGAVTPAIAPVEVAANSTVGVSFPIVPAAFATGITAVFSSTCGLTKTASATALFSGQVK